nr:MAG TPA: hypothetical protein [Caudoviricetes sp.]
MPDIILAFFFATKVTKSTLTYLTMKVTKGTFKTHQTNP